MGGGGEVHTLGWDSLRGYIYIYINIVGSNKVSEAVYVAGRGRGEKKEWGILSAGVGKGWGKGV